MSILDKRLIAEDAETGATDWYHYESSTGGFTVEHVQDVEPIVDQCKLIHSNAERGWKGDMVHVARIPLVILAKLRKDGTLADPKKFKAWLNERDNRVFRTHEGSV